MSLEYSAPLTHQQLTLLKERAQSMVEEEASEGGQLAVGEDENEVVEYSVVFGDDE